MGRRREGTVPAYRGPHSSGQGHAYTDSNHKEYFGVYGSAASRAAKSDWGGAWIPFRIWPT
jgi:hypothetical protein